MRRWGAGLLAAILIGCVGCAKKPQAVPDTAQFACDFTATYREMRVAGSLKRYGAGTLSLTFTEPETLSGLAAVWDGEAVTFSLHGLSFSADPAVLPESALGQELVAVLDGALRGEGDCRTEQGKLVVNGTVNGTAYTLVCDGESGKPVSLSVPSLPLEATFIYS